MTHLVITGWVTVFKSSFKMIFDLTRISDVCHVEAQTSDLQVLGTGPVSVLSFITAEFFCPLLFLFPVMELGHKAA